MEENQQKFNQQLVSLKNTIKKLEDRLRMIDRIPQLQDGATLADVVLAINKITRSIKR